MFRKKEIKLYEAHSIFTNFHGRAQLVVNWYYADKRNLEMDYSKAIDDYKSMDKQEKEMAMEIVNEYFTLEEIKLLKRGLGNYSEGFYYKELNLPIKTKVPCDNGIELSSMSNKALSTPQNTVDLSKLDGYDLPFSICGYYELDEIIPAPMIDLSEIVGFEKDCKFKLIYSEPFKDSDTLSSEFYHALENGGVEFVALDQIGETIKGNVVNNTIQ